MHSCSCLKISGMTHEALKWKLFPFSLSEEAKQWYIRVVGCMNGSWNELRNRFCYAFFSLSRICILRTEVLTFRQNDKESIGVAWADLPYWSNQALTFHFPSIYCSSIFMLVLTRSLRTTSISLLEVLLLISPQMKAGKSLTGLWTELLSLASTSRPQQDPRCVKRKFQ